MPLIAISGSHSTGKSTVIEELGKSEAMTKRFQFIGEVLRDLKKKGVAINEMGTDETQKLVLSKFLEYSTLKNAILDRCALDGLVYTAYLYEKKQVRKNTLRIAEAIFENIQYDIHFYISPEFDIVPDGTRSEDAAFRDRIAELFEEYIDAYKLMPCRLTGTVEERAAQFIGTVEKYDEWIKMESKDRQDLLKTVSNIS